MKLLLNVFLFLLIIKIKISFESENYSIIFPFSTIKPKDPELTPSLNLTLMTNILQNIFLNDIYLKIEIGTPPQNINLRISVNIDDFFLSKDTALFEKEYPKKNGNFYYNQLLSSTFFNQANDKGRTYFSHRHMSEYVKDNFIFYSTKNNNDNKILVKNFTFLLADKVMGPNHGVVGLKGGLSEKLERKDIFDSLKKNNLIKNCIWYLKYDNIYSGSLIIGNYPHNDDNIIKEGKNELLKINRFRKIYTNIDQKNWGNQWGLTFDKILIKNISNSPFTYDEILKDTKNNKHAFLNPNVGVIIGPKHYKFLLENIYLNKFLDNKICFQPMLKIRINYENKLYYYYYCNVSYLEQIKKEFMPIFFEHKEFNYNFTLTFDDIFIQKNNYIFLKIIFDCIETDWVLGAPFLSKYLFVFDSDSKEIGFYSPNIYDNIEEETKNYKINNSIGDYILKIIIGFVLIIIGIFIGKKLFGLRRKLRANELEEKFEYKPAEKIKQLF